MVGRRDTECECKIHCGYTANISVVPSTVNCSVTFPTLVWQYSELLMAVVWQYSKLLMAVSGPEFCQTTVGNVTLQLTVLDTTEVFAVYPQVLSHFPRSQNQDCAEEIRNSPRERFIRFDEFFFVQNFSFLLTKNLKMNLEKKVFSKSCSFFPLFFRENQFRDDI